MAPLPANVLDVKTAMSPQGIADAVKQAKHHESQLLWEGTVAPAALAVLAVLLLGGAVWAGRRRSAPAGGAAGAGGTDSADSAGSAGGAGDKAEPEAAAGAAGTED